MRSCAFTARRTSSSDAAEDTLLVLYTRLPAQFVSGSGARAPSGARTGDIVIAEASPRKRRRFMRAVVPARGPERKRRREGRGATTGRRYQNSYLIPNC